MDNKEKIKYYPIIVMNITNIVEAAYFRALNGGERSSLRTARSVIQNEPLGMGMQGMGMGYHGGMRQQKKFSVFRPTTWGR